MEILNYAKPAYNFNSPSKLICHLDGNPGTNLPGLTTIPNISSKGLFGTARYLAAPKAYGTSSVYVTGTDGVIFLNSSNSEFNKVPKDFTIEMYLGLTGIPLNLTDVSQINMICIDRNPGSSPYVPPGPYPAWYTYKIYLDNRGFLIVSLKDKSGGLILNSVNTGVNVFNMLSNSNMKHFLFQVNDGVFSVYLNGESIYSINVPSFNGSQYAGQIAFLNNETLSLGNTRLAIDEIRISDFARVTRNFIPPTIPFNS